MSRPKASRHYVIEAARPQDGAAVLRLLEANGLPVDGAIACLDTAFVVHDGDRVIGVAALEIYGDGALLRSVVVDPAVRGHGLGQRLTSTALDLARMLEMPAVYLLTTTAERFFPKCGFTAIARAEVPPGVQQSVEFQSVCPSSAAVMRAMLQNH